MGARSLARRAGDQRRWLEEPVAGFRLARAAIDVAPQRVVLAQASARNARAPRAALERRVIELLDAFPAFRRHQSDRLASPAAATTFASRQSRMTVSAETFSTDAVSSTLNPPKNRSSMTRLLRSSNFASASSASSSATKSCSRLAGDDERLVEGDLHRTAAAFLRVARARVIDQDAAHHARRDREEVRAILPRDGRSVDQPDIRLVDQRGRLQAVAHALSRHAACAMRRSS